MNVGFVHLGCSKNLVDTEMAIGLFRANNFKIVNDVKEAEMIVINTCGFIESAKQEAIDTILEMAEYKKTGKCKYLIAMGCLVQRYLKDLEKTMPEVDLFIPINNYNQFWKEVQKLIPSNKSINQLDYLDRVIATGKTTAYLKIAEGCSNKCTYCAIPYIRGEFVSRTMEDILNEAKRLAKEGFKEIILIAQDTTKYGVDIYGEPKLHELLEKLCKIKEFKWVRFLYSYPEGITDELIKVVKNNDKICRYFDIPVQHVSDKVLKRMNRRTTKKDIENKVIKIKEEIPNAILRTSLIVGFPGETEEQFNELYEFVGKKYFDRIGVFEYSKEDGTPAARLPEQVHYKTKRRRYNKIMESQKEISKEKLKEHIGKTYEVLVENASFDNKYYIGRTYMDIPETDGVVYIKGSKKLETGTWVKCKITETKEYDLIAEKLEGKNG